MFEPQAKLSEAKWKIPKTKMVQRLAHYGIIQTWELPDARLRGLPKDWIKTKMITTSAQRNESKRETN